MQHQHRDKLFAIGAGVAAGVALSIARPAYSFRNRVALITGGSRGLGLVLARKLVDERAAVVICGRDHDTLERAAHELHDRGGAVLAFPCEISDATQTRELVERVISEWGRLDVLINNAGGIRMAPFDDTTNEDFQKAVDDFLLGPLNSVRAALPHLRHSRGRIVNISSIGGLVSVPHLIPYCAGKHALTALSRGLRAELRRDGVTVTTVCPGLMRTGSPRHAEFKGRHVAEYAWFSIADSLPVVTMSADQAAAKVLEACRRGRAQVTLTVPAKAAALLDAVAPGVSSALIEAATSLLPSPGGIGRQIAKGHQSESLLSPSLLTTLTERAARRNNQTAPASR